MKCWQVISKQKKAFFPTLLMICRIHAHFRINILKDYWFTVANSKRLVLPANVNEKNQSPNMCVYCAIVLGGLYFFSIGCDAYTSYGIPR